MVMQVYQGICKTNDEKVAIKKLDLDDIALGVHWVCDPCPSCVSCASPQHSHAKRAHFTLLSKSA